MDWIILSIVVLFFMLIFNGKSKKEHMSVRIATKTDKLKAQKYALKKLCEEKNYVWKQFDNEFMYDCKHTKGTCLAESVYPTPETENAVPRYYEWRDTNSSDYKEAVRLESSSAILSSLAGVTEDRSSLMGGEDGMCIMGSEGFRKFCEDEKLRYDDTDGNCYTTRQYCQPKLLAFCNNDCFEPPMGMVLSKVFGTTIGRALGATSVLDAALIGAC